MAKKNAAATVRDRGNKSGQVFQAVGRPQGDAPAAPKVADSWEDFVPEELTLPDQDPTSRRGGK
jgi:hypothetical protein